MPRLPRSSKQPTAPCRSSEATPAGPYLEEHFEELTHQFNAAKLHYTAMQAQCHRVQQECCWLQQVVWVKQHLIEQLLPYYPLPLTPELLRAIELY